MTSNARLNNERNDRAACAMADCCSKGEGEKVYMNPKDCCAHTDSHDRLTHGSDAESDSDKNSTSPLEGQEKSEEEETKPMAQNNFPYGTGQARFWSYTFTIPGPEHRGRTWNMLSPRYQWPEEDLRLPAPRIPAPGQQNPAAGQGAHTTPAASAAGTPATAQTGYWSGVAQSRDRDDSCHSAHTGRSRSKAPQAHADDDNEEDKAEDADRETPESAAAPPGQSRSRANSQRRRSGSRRPSVSRSGRDAGNVSHHRDHVSSFRARDESKNDDDDDKNDDGIIYEGDGMVLAGQSSEHFQEKWSLELCYQCCKRVPLNLIHETRNQRCDLNSCRRAEKAGLMFMTMPPDALDACDEFRTLVVWWMDKLDCGACPDICDRARTRVQEVRDEVPRHGRGNY
ncbi:hypothetical protein F5Y17DRAFT_474646 [Xylariaceae sp. FL0594]|nr:hypothetical protein F5Y17DRAFT_474646 [Xylariaceae sp. FL0594]